MPLVTFGRGLGTMPAMTAVTLMSLGRRLGAVSTMPAMSTVTFVPLGRRFAAVSGVALRRCFFGDHGLGAVSGVLGSRTRGGGSQRWHSGDNPQRGQ
jgi:hypothetical protein